MKKNLNLVKSCSKDKSNHFLVFLADAIIFKADFMLSGSYLLITMLKDRLKFKKNCFFVTK